MSQVVWIAGQHSIARLSQRRDVCVDDVAAPGSAQQQTQAFASVKIQQRGRHTGQGPHQLSLTCTVAPHLRYRGRAGAHRDARGRRWPITRWSWIRSRPRWRRLRSVPISAVARRSGPSGGQRGETARPDGGVDRTSGAEISGAMMHVAPVTVRVQVQAGAEFLAFRPWELATSMGCPWRHAVMWLWSTICPALTVRPRHRWATHCGCWRCSACPRRPRRWRCAGSVMSCLGWCAGSPPEANGGWSCRSPSTG
jgi:hypothetical protein